MSLNEQVAVSSPVRTRQSILYEPLDVRDHTVEIDEPACFGDLLLNQVVASLQDGREEYNLLPYLYDHLDSVDAVAFRHEVWRDLNDDDLVGSLREFTDAMHRVRNRLRASTKSSFIQQRQGLRLDAAAAYCVAVGSLFGKLSTSTLSSRGLTGFREYLDGYLQSPSFRALDEDSRSLKAQLADVRYCVNIKGNRVRVLRFDGEKDYREEIEETFERFRQGAVTDYRQTFHDTPDMNHVESFIADRVALLFKEVFSSLRTFCDSHVEFLDNTVTTFLREVQFFLSYLDYIEPLKTLGLSFCLPEVQGQSKELSVRQSFDLALAKKLASGATGVVTNDFQLDNPERIIVISGPNQGGKTTFSRMFGQIHYLASLGYPVPGESAKVALFDELFTHFGREEDESYQSGKLEEDLLRIRDVLQCATSRSILIMNEIFSSTTAHDALVLGTKVLEKVIELDALCVVVTFVDELTTLGPSIVSMTSMIDPVDPVVRTFKVVRHPADGLAYAMAIAEKYGLTYDTLRKRIES